MPERQRRPPWTRSRTAFAHLDPIRIVVVTCRGASCRKWIFSPALRLHHGEIQYADETRSEKGTEEDRWNVDEGEE